MAEAQAKATQGQDAEKARERERRPEPAPELVKALAGDSIPSPDLLGDSAINPPVERHAAFLGDPRFCHSANNGQKARMMTELQQNYGNAYVQRVVAQATTLRPSIPIQEKRDEGLSDGELPSDIAQRIEHQRGSGTPLDPEVRSQMEDAFGYNFSDVQIHTNASAEKLARELRAKAFTSGKDVFFREGAYQPNSEAGKGLLAHELTHVVQQDNAPKAMKQVIDQERDALEVEAAASELAIRDAGPVKVKQALEVPGVQRQSAGPAVGTPVSTVEFTEKEAGVIEVPVKTIEFSEKEAGVIQVPLKEFLSTMKMAIWPEPKDGKIDWLVADPARIFLTPYSDEVNPGISFSTFFVVSPEKYLDRSGTSPVKEWPRNGKLGCKHDFFLKGASDFDLYIILDFKGLDPKARPPLMKKIHVTHWRRKKFLDTIKIAVWPEPKGGNIEWLTDDPMNVFLTPYSDEVNPGIGFSTLFLIAPDKYIDRPGLSPVKEWPRNGKLGCKYDFFLKGATKGAHDFDLYTVLDFEGLDPKERPPVIRKIHIIDMRPSRRPELPAMKKIFGQEISEKRYKVVPGLSQLHLPRSKHGPKIEPEDIDQEHVGTCYFLASLAAVAKDHPKVIENMIKDNKDGTFTVTFYESTGSFFKPGYRPVEVTVDNKLPMYTLKGGKGQWSYLGAKPADVSKAGSELWVAIAEKAYAKWKGGYPDVTGGWPVKALPEITGVEAKQHSTSAFSDKDLLEEISKALAAGHPVTACAIPSKAEELLERFLIPRLIAEATREALNVYYSHAYTVMEVKDSTIKLRNPWGTNHPVLPVALFKYYFKVFTISGL